MSYRPATPYTEKLNLRVTAALKAELEAEAWESQLPLSLYVRGLLTRRGKWARSVGHPGNYDLQADLPPSKRGGNT